MTRSKSKEPSQTQPPLTPAVLQSLQSQHNLLQLFHHRNKNQHRRNPWYRHLDIFRRQLRSLITEIQGTLDTITPSSTNLDSKSNLKPKSKSNSKSGSNAVLSRLQILQSQRKILESRKSRCGMLIKQRLRHWEEGFIAKWYDSFGQLVADPQFAAMGVFLLAILGRVCGVLGVVPRRGKGVEVMEGVEGGLVGAAEDGLMNVVVDDGKGMGEDQFDDGIDLGTRIEREAGESEIDSGPMGHRVSISRTMLDRQHDQKAPNQASPKSRAKTKATSPPSTTLGKATGLKPGTKRPADSPFTKTTSSKNKKTKKSKGNAIDDLFSGLF